MTQAVTVSIGIPFLNAKKTLADAVRSVLAQSFGDWELLLVDDGSTDGSVEVAGAIRHPRVRLLCDGVNRGLPNRLNQIAALARGRFLARMDADDLMHPERLQRQVHFLEANPRVDLVDTATFTIDDGNEPLGIRGDRPQDCDPPAVLKAGLLIHPTVMGRTGWFRANPYDARYVRAEDKELWVRTCRRTAFGRLHEPLFFYREGLSGNLRNYLRTEKTNREILRVYGPEFVGRFGTALLLARSHLRGWIYWAFTRLGLQARLIKARTRPLTAAESAVARGALRTVLQTTLPISDPVDHEQAIGHDRLAESPSGARLHGPADVELSRPAGGVCAAPGV
jgi:glycosyltransferase involved in cell wall biosynthesis